MPLDGNELLSEAANKMSVDLPALVAACTLWAHPDAFTLVRRRHPHGAWFPNYRRAKADEKRGMVIGGITLDDNSKANSAIKLAIFGSIKECRGFHACHLWPRSCYDDRYHTSIANLVLLPAALSALTDYSTDVAACLRYRAFELYRWHPEGVEAPVKPLGYPKEAWRPPDSVTSKVCKALKNLNARQIDGDSLRGSHFVLTPLI